MLEAITRVLLFQAAGEMICDAASLPLPGAALGLAMAFAYFVAQGGVDEASERLFDGTVNHLPLLFVPAAVVIVVQPSIISAGLLPILLSVVVGTVVTMAVVAVIGMAFVNRSVRSSANAEHAS